MEDCVKSGIRFIGIVLLLPGWLSVCGQGVDATVRKGNRYYRKADLDKSQEQYKKALRQTPTDPAANYNLGNTQFRKNDFEQAEASYNTTINNSNDKTVREKGYYNRGVAQVKQQKLQESIDSWKNALKIDAADSDARDNLEKALHELKMKQPPPPQQQKQKQQEQKKDQQKPQQSKLSKQQVDQLLKALQQKEKEVQDKMNQSKTQSAAQPDKDW
jgi:tetratricopeptide (TPR) repeat protein